MGTKTKKYTITNSFIQHNDFIDEIKSHKYCPDTCPFFELNSDSFDSCSFIGGNCPFLSQDDWKCVVTPFDEKRSKYTILKSFDLSSSFVDEMREMNDCHPDCPCKTGSGVSGCDFRLTCPFENEADWKCEVTEWNVE